MISFRPGRVRGGMSKRFMAEQLAFVFPDDQKPAVVRYSFDAGKPGVKRALPRQHERTDESASNGIRGNLENVPEKKWDRR